ncbi:hypothetical protein SAMN02910292_00252 [Lachnospiraceae bacterium XBB2008]|nr:hypothetical protein SAMN02910292_00252 [Lachnospiraceae bacterium XBB2008]
MARKNRIIFTAQEQSDKGIMALVLGILCSGSVAYSLIASYLKQGEVNSRFGGALLVTLLMAVVGLILGAMACSDVDKRKAVPTVGVILNVIVILVLGALLWIGLN